LGISKKLQFSFGYIFRHNLSPTAKSKHDDIFAA